MAISEFVRLFAFGTFMYVLVAPIGCGHGPAHTLQAAEHAIERAKSETDSEPCMQMVLSAEQYLQKAKMAYKLKNYEMAKYEAFQSLRASNNAHDCAKNNQDADIQSEEKPE